MGGFTFRFLDRQMMTSTVIVWLAAAFLTIGAMGALLGAVRGGVEMVAAQAAPIPTVVRAETPVAEPELKKILDRLRVLHPALVFTVQNGEIKIVAGRGEQYSDWNAAIADLLQSGDRSIFYETVSLCGAKCESNEFYVASFKAKRLNFSVN